MKTFVQTVFNSMGYKIKRVSKIANPKSDECFEHDIEFVKDERFEIEFIHQILDGKEYFIPKYALHRPAVIDLLNGYLFEPDTHYFVKEFCKTFSGSVVHAGAFFGDMLPHFSKYVDGTLYAFEPVLENYILAKLCVDRNKLENVVLINSALSGGLGNLYINTRGSSDRHAGGASSISDKGTICTSINIDRLNIEDLVLIQLDVEGHELIALQGALATIQKNRPVIAIEDNNNNCTDYLCSIEYENVGHLPGLSIWVPIENNRYKDKIKLLMD